MRTVPLVRAAHLNVYLDVLHDIGAPVWKCLQNAGLPATTEETPDLYLSVPRVLECVSNSGGSDAAMELGFLAAQSMTIDAFRPEFQRALLNAPNCLSRLRTVFRYARMEDGALTCGVHSDGTSVRLICDLAGFSGSSALGYSDWLQLQAMVSVVRSVAGPLWYPEEMTFVSGSKPSDAANEAFPHTRILTGQTHTSILIPCSLLGMPCRSATDPDDIFNAPTEEALHCTSQVDAMRELLKPYLRDRPLLAAEFADILGTSERSLQRHLQNQNVTFSQLVDEARYQVACEMLAAPDVKVADVAYATGYENPPHFSRAFRRIGGLAPRDYRRSLQPDS